MKRLAGLIVVLALGACNDDPEASLVRVLLPDGMGTGFIINDKGIVATNRHVVEDFATAKVAIGRKGKGTLHDAKVVWRSAELDLAILSAPTLAGTGVPVTLATEEPPKGAEVFALGYPGAADRAVGTTDLIEASLTKGVVSRNIDGSWVKNGPTLRMVQHNAEINPGNSGGPLFDGCQRVVGVNTAGALTYLEADNTITNPQGIYYSSHVASLAKALKGQGIDFRSSGGACSAGNAGFLYWGIALAVLLSGSGMVLALRRPRERIIQVTESYTQFVRRHGRPTPTPTPTPGPTEPRLTMIAIAKGGQRVTQTFDAPALRQGIVIGRDASVSHLTLPDDSVSRRHARILLSGSALTIEDLNSANGVVIDGTKLPARRPQPVVEGSRIAVGETQLTVSWRGP